MELTQIRIEVFGTSISQIHSWDLHLTDSQLARCILRIHSWCVGVLGTSVSDKSKTVRGSHVPKQHEPNTPSYTLFIYFSDHCTIIMIV